MRARGTAEPPFFRSLIGITSFNVARHSIPNRVDHVLIGHVVTQSISHHAPRYFYKGTGTFRKRALYAIATAFVTKGDKSRWQPDYSDVIGGLAAAEISTLYYPASSRTGLRLFYSFLLGFGHRAGSHLIQEVVYRKFSNHVPKVVRSQPILRDGTPVSLISIENLHASTPQSARPVTFVLTKVVEADGVAVALAGSRATGQATYTGAESRTIFSLRGRHRSHCASVVLGWRCHAPASPVDFSRSDGPTPEHSKKCFGVFC